MTVGETCCFYANHSGMIRNYLTTIGIKVYSPLCLSWPAGPKISRTACGSGSMCCKLFD